MKLSPLLLTLLLGACASKPSETLGGIGFDVLKIALQAVAGGL